jgi:hypothetical protein
MSNEALVGEFWRQGYGVAEGIFEEALIDASVTG